jgi:heat shock protein HslJ
MCTFLRAAWLWCLIGLTACGGADSTAPGDTPAPPMNSRAAPPPAEPAAPPEVDSTRWSLIESGLASPAPEQADRVRLEFKGGRVNADSGCNLAVGAYRFEANALVIDQMATTRRACIGAAAAYESAFFGFLGVRPLARLEADGDELVLEASGGTLRFAAQPMPSANAVQKFIYVAAERVPCRGAGPTTTDCLQVRERPDQPWRAFYAEIIGFTPEPGIEYRLRVLEDPVVNPPADASSRRWYLDLVVEQKIVTR